MNLRQVQHHYRRLARLYEPTLLERPLNADSRRAAIDGLQLSPGATVVDVACGTGLSFARLHRQIGPSGHLVGIDLIETMLGRARQRVERAGWSNVTLVQADMATTTGEHLVSMAHCAQISGSTRSSASSGCR
ncbi:MAG TPA: methyltransferase domain-containing protein [Solirubrobacteraceae bacterium]|nr:methyltransferase domain-containing protein [Solirubrobacteraceae bacterium]